jgi:hypothetical protein
MKPNSLTILFISSFLLQGCIPLAVEVAGTILGDLYMYSTEEKVVEPKTNPDGLPIQEY